MTFAQLLRAAIQAFYFLLIARALGPQGYGGFIAVAAMVTVAAPFSGVGVGNLLIQRVARDKSTFRVNWGNALFVTGISAPVLLILITWVGAWILPSSVPVRLIIVIGISDLLFSRIADLSGQAAQAREQLQITAGIMILTTVARAAAAVFLVTSGGGATPLRWSLFYLTSSVVSAVLAAGLITRRYGAPKLDLALARRSFREGIYFAIGVSAQSTYNDVDKTLLASLGTTAVAGVYGAGYRVIDATFMPIRGLLFAAYARFFQYGSSGLGESSGFGRSLLPLSLSYGMAVTIVLWFVAPLIPGVIGPGYGDIVQIVRLLSLLPILRALHYIAADALTGAGLQRERSYIQVGVGVFNLGLNVILIPFFSWRGAAFASLVSDALLGGALWWLVMVRIDRARVRPVS